MTYLVLARKFRPQRFGTVVGQEHISLALANSIVRGRVPHALLFTGPRGVGKTTSARIFAKALNCEKRPETFAGVDEEKARELVEPCDVCANCKEIARSASLAVWEIDGASNNSVENVRDLIDSLRSVPPPGSRFKIYIIDEVHMLSVAAFNALLKSLEEPPPNTVFVFATTEPHKIPETVISRCQRHDFRRIAVKLIVSQLEQIAESENVRVRPEVFRLLARKANGGMRDAESMLDRLLGYAVGDDVTLEIAENVLGIVGRELFVKLAGAILQQDVKGALALAGVAFSQSVDVRTFAGDFLAFWRDLFFVSSSKADAAYLAEVLELTADEVDELSGLIAGKEPFDIQRLFDLATKTVEQTLLGHFPRYAFEAGVAKMADLAALRPLAKIIADLKEGQGKAGPARAANASSASTPEAVMPPAAEALSWPEFVSQVRAQNHPLLHTYLKRISVRKFDRGLLELGAGQSDATFLEEQENLAKLRQCLQSYAGPGPWRIQISKSAAPTPAPAEGSLRAQEDAEKLRRKASLEEEARNNPLVQAALSTFSGSTIDRIIVDE